MTFDPLLTAERSRSAGPPPGRRPLSPASRRVLVVVGLCALAAAIVVAIVAATDRNGAGVTTAAPSAGAAAGVAAPSATQAALSTTTPSIDAPGSLWWLVNRDRPLPPGYVPAGLVVPEVPREPEGGPIRLTAATAAAFEAMVADAAAAGHELQLTSGYRSEQDQQALYDRFVEDFGTDVADELVALPGTSEHQTGLAADVGQVGLPDDQVFGTTAASAWVAADAQRFGFIIRYPPAKADITGYADEPWHLRYVGVELATELHASALTMEERFGLVPA